VGPVPTFCRHNRFIQNCPICREPEPEPKARRASRSGSSGRASSSSGSSRGGAGVKVRRVARSADDGYRSDLVPGLRSSEDARRLAEEIGFAAGRLTELASAPRGLYEEAAVEADREEALWLAAFVALLGPLEGDDPFAALRAARVSWAGGETPSLEGVELGPRKGVHDGAEGERALSAYRAWAARGGGQEAALRGDASWTPERRFERAYERLGSLRGFSRPARYDLLVTLGWLGLLDARAASLHLGDGDDASLAARRVFGIADKFLLERRSGTLAEEADVPLEALDLALANFGSDRGRMTQGAGADAADADATERAADALGVE
jgi:hypothetical protein